MNKLFMYLCFNMWCKHYFEEFIVEAEKKPTGYIKCPNCSSSAEENGLGGDRLVDRFVVPSKR